MSQVERTREHTLDEEHSDDKALATLSDRQENRYQMQEIARRTVEKGLMRLSVVDVTSAENSQQWAIDIAHPAMEDTMRIFAEKPMEGWDREYKIVKMLDWVGELSTRDPHKLEFHDLYMEKNPDESDYAHGWQVVAPPDYDPPIPVQLRQYAEKARGLRPSASNAKMYGFILAGGVLGPVLHGWLLDAVQALVPTPLSVLVSMLFMTIMGMVVLDA